MNLLDAQWMGGGRLRIGEQVVTTDFAAAPLAEGSKLVFGIRPEHLQIVGAGAMFQATVDFTEYLGGVRYIYCRLDGQNLIVEQRDGRDIEDGAVIGLSAASEKCRYFESGGSRMR